MSDLERLLADPETRRCFDALTGVKPPHLDDYLACYGTRPAAQPLDEDDEALYRAYSEFSGSEPREERAHEHAAGLDKSDAALYAQLTEMTFGPPLDRVEGGGFVEVPEDLVRSIDESHAVVSRHFLTDHEWATALAEQWGLK